MEDVLDLYAEPYDPKRPVVCFDETSTQLLAETRAPMPPRPGRPQRQDYEYRREGTRNLFLACEPLAGWRHVKGVEKVSHCGGGIVYHRHDEKELNWEPGGVRSGAGVRRSGLSQESSGSSETWQSALCRLLRRR